MQREINFFPLSHPEKIRTLFEIQAVKDIYGLFDPLGWNWDLLDEYGLNREELIVEMTTTYSLMEGKWDWELLASLCIETIPPGLCKRICERFNYHDLPSLTEFDLRKVPELTEKNIRHFLDYFSTEGKNAYSWLFWSVGLQLRSSLLFKEQRYENEFVYFHGSFDKIWELHRIVTENGGVVRNQYSEMVTLVVVDRSLTLEAAKSLFPNCEVVTEDSFRRVSNS